MQLSARHCPSCNLHFRYLKIYHISSTADKVFFSTQLSGVYPSLCSMKPDFSGSMRRWKHLLILGVPQAEKWKVLSYEIQCLGSFRHQYYPPTPALAKAGAAPGTTAGVELLLLSLPRSNASHSQQAAPRPHRVNILLACFILQFRLPLYLAKTTSYAREARHTIPKIWKQHSMNSHGSPWYQYIRFIVPQSMFTLRRPSKTL